jgi:hypothetical protein
MHFRKAIHANIVDPAFDEAARRKGDARGPHPAIDPGSFSVQL